MSFVTSLWPLFSWRLGTVENGRQKRGFKTSLRVWYLWTKSPHVYMRMGTIGSTQLLLAQHSYLTEKSIIMH